MVSLPNHGDATGIRTRVTRMRTWRPKPLDDGALAIRSGISAFNYYSHCLIVFNKQYVVSNMYGFYP